MISAGTFSTGHRIRAGRFAEVNVIRGFTELNSRCMHCPI